MDYKKSELLKQITELDFVIVDLNLYLDTHPMDQAALAHFNSCIAKTNLLKEKYEKLYGMLTACMGCSPYPWQWINEPWPWEYDANFEFWGKE